MGVCGDDAIKKVCARTSLSLCGPALSPPRSNAAALSAACITMHVCVASGGDELASCYHVLMHSLRSPRGRPLLSAARARGASSRGRTCVWGPGHYSSIPV